MDDSVLRGFCQHGNPYYFDMENKEWAPLSLDAPIYGCFGKCVISAFLSPNQMQEISIFFHKQTKPKSHSFGDIMEAQHEFQETEYGKWANWVYDEFEAGGVLLINYMALLSENPFLVARILADSAKDVKE